MTQNPSWPAGPHQGPRRAASPEDSGNGLDTHPADQSGAGAGPRRGSWPAQDQAPWTAAPQQPPVTPQRPLTQQQGIWNQPQHGPWQAQQSGQWNQQQLNPWQTQWNRTQPNPWVGQQQNPWTSAQNTQWQQQTFQGNWADPRGPRPQRPTAGRVVVFTAAVVLGLTALVFVMGMLNGSGAQNIAPVDYKNEDYAVPRENLRPPTLPRPQTRSQAKDWATANVLYVQKVATPIRCELSDFNYGSASDAEMEEHLNSLMTCVLKLWGPTLEAAGYTPVRPHVTVHSQPIRNKCGETPMPNASYCSADQQIYVSADLLKVVPSSLRGQRFMIDLVLAHEFGHAVQGRSGILRATAALEGQNPESPESNQLSRRTEMQADCFAGMFMGSIAQSTGQTEFEAQSLGEMISSLGDDSLSNQDESEYEHGTGENRRKWLETGLSSTAVGSCNTFIAPESAVR